MSVVRAGSAIRAVRACTVETLRVGADHRGGYLALFAVFVVHTLVVVAAAERAAGAACAAEPHDVVPRMTRGTVRGRGAGLGVSLLPSVAEVAIQVRGGLQDVSVVGAGGVVVKTNKEGAVLLVLWDVESEAEI